MQAQLRCTPCSLAQPTMTPLPPTPRPHEVALQALTSSAGQGGLQDCPKPTCDEAASVAGSTGSNWSGSALDVLLVALLRSLRRHTHVGRCPSSGSPCQVLALSQS